METGEYPGVLLMDDDQECCNRAYESLTTEGHDVWITPTFEEMLARIHEDQTRNLVVLVDPFKSGSHAVFHYIKNAVDHRVMVCGWTNWSAWKEMFRDREFDSLQREIFKSTMQRSDAKDLFDKEHDSLHEISYRITFSPVWKLLRGVTRDHLTGLDNYLGFTKIVEQLLETMRADREREIGDPTYSSGILVLDANKFKAINDNHGHLKGDEAIQVIAKAIKDHVRPYDYPCRKSGDEFLVWLPGADRSTVKRVGEKLQREVSKAVLNGRDNLPLKLSISFGAADVRRYEVDHDVRKTLRELIAKADRALYDAKEALT